MKFGIVLLPVFALETNPQQLFDHLMIQVRTAKKNNFASIWAAHHYLTDNNQMYQPIPLLARAAAEGPGMIFGTSVYLLPFTNPVAAAEQIATMDIITGGKFIFGTGLGYRDIEFEVFGLPKKEGPGRLVESVQIMKKIWSNDEVSFNGRYFKFSNASIHPKPVQKGGPPVYIGADSEPGVRRAAKYSDSWLISPRHSLPFVKKLASIYYEVRRQNHLPQNSLPVFRELHVAETKDIAVKEVRKLIESMYHQYAKWKQPGEKYDLSFEELSQQRYIIGDPGACIEDVARILKELKVAHMFFRIYWPGMKPSLALKTIKLFGQKVIPYFQTAKK